MNMTKDAEQSGSDKWTKEEMERCRILSILMLAEYPDTPWWENEDE